MRIKDSVVVITGASSGIGWTTALRFAGKGARLVLAARGSEALHSLVPAHVTDPEAVEALAARAVEEFGRPVVWVNNAAVSVFGRSSVVGEISQPYTAACSMAKAAASTRCQRTGYRGG